MTIQEHLANFLKYLFFSSGIPMRVSLFIERMPNLQEPKLHYSSNRYQFFKRRAYLFLQEHTHFPIRKPFFDSNRYWFFKKHIHVFTKQISTFQEAVASELHIGLFLHLSLEIYVMYITLVRPHLKYVQIIWSPKLCTGYELKRLFLQNMVPNSKVFSPICLFSKHYTLNNLSPRVSICLSL